MQLLSTWEDFVLDRTIPYDERFQSDERISVVIVRDPYNWAAATLGRLPFDQNSIALWKQYARAYLENEDIANRRTLYINFNRWVAEPGYLNTVTEFFAQGETETSFFPDGVLDVVQTVGGGSTTDGTTYDGRGREMKLLNRFESALEERDSRFFDLVLADAELDAFARQLFPEARAALLTFIERSPALKAELSLTKYQHLVAD